MSGSNYADDLGSAVHHALETTHAIAVCPFHLDLMIGIGDDAAESHAFARARKLVKTDGTTWEGEALRKEFGRQLRRAANRYCPHCALLGDRSYKRLRYRGSSEHSADRPLGLMHSRNRHGSTKLPDHIPPSSRRACSWVVRGQSSANPWRTSQSARSAPPTAQEATVRP